VELDLHSHIYFLGVKRDKLDVVRLFTLFGQKQLQRGKDNAVVINELAEETNSG
jgi:hypothetical protein